MSKGPQPWESQLLIDCDGVIASLIPHVQALAAAEGYEFVARKGDNVDYFREIREDPDCPITDILKAPGFGQGIPVESGAHDFLDTVRGIGLEVTCLTSSWDESETWDYDRKQWLKKHFKIDQYHVVFSKQKWSTCGLTLVEDKAENANLWAEQHDRPSVLITQPWNMLSELDPRVIRVKNLDEAAVAIRSLHARNRCSS